MPHHAMERVSQVADLGSTAFTDGQSAEHRKVPVSVATVLSPLGVDLVGVDAEAGKRSRDLFDREFAVACEA